MFQAAGPAREHKDAAPCIHLFFSALYDLLEFSDIALPIGCDMLVHLGYSANNRVAQSLAFDDHRRIIKNVLKCFTPG